MKRIFTLLITFALGTIGINAKAQQTFSATSNSATIQGNTYEYVIGEMAVISTDRTPNLIVTQGFLQPKTGNKPSQLTNQDAPNLIKVYPNPTENVVFIESLDNVKGNYAYQLLDAAGRILTENNVQGMNKFSIPVESYASGNYYIQIQFTKEDGVVYKYAYKIQKK